MAGELKTESESSNFKEQVYRFVKNIPKGKVATYGQIASKINQISNIKDQNFSLSARAVGSALHQNRDPNVPCHRVVDRNGRLAPNFAFDGAEEQKRRLLTEGVKFLDNMHVDLQEYSWG